MDAGELSFRLAEPAEGLVDLRHSRIKIFRDDPGVFTFSMHGAANFPFRKQLKKQNILTRLPSLLHL